MDNSSTFTFKPLTKTKILDQLYHTNQKIQKIIDGEIYERPKQSEIINTTGKLVTDGQKSKDIARETTNLLTNNIQNAKNDSSAITSEQQNINDFLKLKKQKSSTGFANSSYEDNNNSEQINQNNQIKNDAQNAIIDIRNIFQSKFSQRIGRIKFTLFLGILATSAFTDIVYGFKLQDKISNQLSSYIAIIFLSIIALNLMICFINHIHTAKSIKNLKSSMMTLSENLAKKLIEINKSNDQDKENKIAEIYKIYSELAAINHLACQELKNRSPFTIDPNDLSDRQYQCIGDQNINSKKTLKEQLIFNFIATTSNHESLDATQKQKVISLIDNINFNSDDMKNYLPNIESSDKKFEYEPIKVKDNKVGSLDSQEMKLKQGIISKYITPVAQFLFTTLGLPENTKHAKKIFGKNQG